MSDRQTDFAACGDGFHATLARRHDQRRRQRQKSLFSQQRGDLAIGLIINFKCLGRAIAGLRLKHHDVRRHQLRLDGRRGNVRHARHLRLRLQAVERRSKQPHHKSRQQQSQTGAARRNIRAAAAAGRFLRRCCGRQCHRRCGEALGDGFDVGLQVADRRVAVFRLKLNAPQGDVIQFGWPRPLHGIGGRVVKR